MSFTLLNSEGMDSVGAVEEYWGLIYRALEV